jgi:hypothetical protein
MLIALAALLICGLAALFPATAWAMQMVGAALIFLGAIGLNLLVIPPVALFGWLLILLYVTFSPNRSFMDWYKIFAVGVVASILLLIAGVAIGLLGEPRGELVRGNIAPFVERRLNVDVDWVEPVDEAVDRIDAEIAGD